MSRGWISREVVGKLAHEGTDAQRVWASDRAWIDRYGSDYLISDPAGDPEMLDALLEWAAATGVDAGRVFVRRLVKQPGENDVPRQIHGRDDGISEGIVTERGLRYHVSFATGYSTGLFCDQRENREYLESLKPGGVLNCFAYTCAFTVAAVRAGGKTLSVDLAKKALEAGKRNLALNEFDPAGHRFFADDVFDLLPRLARRGEFFDVIILDPPTFSRGRSGRVFRVEDDFDRLVGLAGAVCEEGGRMLLSTNFRGADAATLRLAAAGFVMDVSAPVMDRGEVGVSTSVWVQKCRTRRF